MPDNAVARPRRHVFVLATDLEATAGAIREASRLVDPMNHAVVLVPHVLDAQHPVDRAHEHDASIRALAAHYGLRIRVHVCACRSRLDIFRQLVTEPSIVIMGEAKAAADNTPLRTALQAQGHVVIVVPAVNSGLAGR